MRVSEKKWGFFGRTDMIRLMIFIRRHYQRSLGIFLSNVSSSIIFTLSRSRIYIRISLSCLSSQLALGYRKKESKELHSCFSYDRKSHAYFNSNSSIDLLYILTWIYLYISGQRGLNIETNCHLPDNLFLTGRLGRMCRVT